MKVAQLMSRNVVTIPRDARTSRAELEMRLAQVRHLPVVDRDQRLVGVVSRHDLDRAAGSGAHGPVNVDDLMHAAVYTTRAAHDAADAAALMLDKKIGSLPVVDEAERVVGILTETDFVQVALHALRGLPLQGDAHVERSSERVRHAFQWIAGTRAVDHSASLRALIDEASSRFALSPPERGWVRWSLDPKSAALASKEPE